MGLILQLKMFGLMNCMNKQFKYGKEKKAGQDKMVELLMIQGLRFFSSGKKLVKVNLPSIFWGLARQDR